MKIRQLLLAALAGALTLFAWEAISNAALPWHTRGVALGPDMAGRETLLGLILGRQLLLNVAVAFVVLLAFQRLPAASVKQYAFGTAAVAFAVSASIFVSNWNWYGFSVAWTVVNTIDRAIGYGLLGLVLGALVNRASGKSTTDEWNGVRTSSGLPSSMSAPRSSSRV